MSLIDGVAVILYFGLVLAAGLWQRRRAIDTLESHFLGARQIPWPLLGLSGAISNFDLTGTMWIVSILYTLGMQSWWQHWMWGVALPAFGMAYMARWVRRSATMTGAEWMITRFGDGAAGRAARYAYASIAVLFTAGSVAYALQGMIKFADYYLQRELSSATIAALETHLPSSPAVFVSLLVLAVTVAYVIAGGLYSVVATDAVQAVLLTILSLIVAVMAYALVTPRDLAARVPSDFTDLAPAWRLTGWRLAERPDLAPFGWFVIAWVVKGFLMNAGGPAQLYDFQRYLAARSPAEACKLAAAWPFFLAPRWALAMGIVLLAMTRDLDHADPEQIMPAILRDVLPAGLRGLFLAGLVAAFMTTLAATINSGAAYLARDLYLPFFGASVPERRMTAVSRVATLAVVALGAAVGVYCDSINVIWTWLQMSFVSSLVIPNCLRWYWWRLNGWGYAAGVLVGSFSSLILLLSPDLPDYYAFAAVSASTTFAAILASLLTDATPQPVLIRFYETVRPFGWWGAVSSVAARTHSVDPGAEPRPALVAFNLMTAICGMTALYLFPMYLVGHWHLEAGVCLAILAVAILLLWRFWLPTLPEDDPTSIYDHRI